MRTEAKAQVARRLARVEGQVRGLSQMLRDDRYCLDVVAQVRAARSALARVEELVLAEHMQSCVEDAIIGGDPALQRRKLAELVALLGARG